MLSVNSLFIWLAYATFTKESKNLQDLTHVKGELTGSRIMKHKHSGKFRTRYEDVMVLQVDPSIDEFGIIEYKKFYYNLAGMIIPHKPLPIDIYYDKNGQRIEQDVTLHIFDMTINGEKFILIEEVKKSEYRGAIICSTVSLLLLWFTFWGSKRIVRRGVIA